MTEMPTGTMRTFSDEDAEPVFDIDESALAAPQRGTVTYFGTDFDVFGLVRRLDLGDIVVPSFDPDIELKSGLEGFQRRFVWNKPQMDRFVESLLLGFPVPGIFLVQEPDQRLLVLDGQQRLRTIQGFYKGIIRDKAFRLENVDTDFRELSYDTLDPESRRQLDNTFIHATVVRYEPERDAEAVYQIFERLNTGGTNLQPHEIRVALFHGRLVNFLRDLNDNDDWRALYGKRSIRLKDQELILRFYALWLESKAYQKPLKTFLNSFVERNREMVGWDLEARAAVFANVVGTIRKTLGASAFRLRSQVNAALCDALMVAFADRLAVNQSIDIDAALDAYQTLLENGTFVATLTSSTADEESVQRRLRLAREAFASV